LARRRRRVPPRPRRLDSPSPARGLRTRAPDRAAGPRGRDDTSDLRLRHRRLGASLAERGALDRPQVGGMSSALATPLLLASTSPQRRTILTQPRPPFAVVAPDYEEDDPPDADPVELVRRHAVGKARSVAALADGRPVLGVDTTVTLDNRVFG